MRLLKRNADGKLVPTEYSGKVVPAYAILSHTWHADNSEEVSFQDIEAGTIENKSGHEKIQFCAQQAEADGLRFFWVDTCCIDKKNAVELAEAINSMFHWYQKATRCYVYLSDVSIHDDEAVFRQCRWFSRGWTLQELLAPGSVEFFSREYQRLGDKRTLERQIHDITNVAVSALRQSTPLSQFTVDERLSWALRRQTTRKEDKAYSLLGIFNVYMPLIYGEGTENAFRRLLEEIDKHSNGKHSTLIHTQYGNEEQASVRKQLPSIEQPIEGLSGGLPPGDNFSAGRPPH